MLTARRRAALVLAAALLTLGGALTLMAAASPARAAPAVIFYDQGDPQGYYMNWWNGGSNVNAYGGVTYNDFIQIVSIGNGQFELVNGTNGGASCVGDAGGAQGTARAGAAFCPTSGTAGWGTIFTLGPSCGGGFNLYRDNHWSRYVGFSNSNGTAVYLNTGGTCLKQQN
jgi:hypothetical protein